MNTRRLKRWAHGVIARAQCEVVKFRERRHFVWRLQPKRGEPFTVVLPKSPSCPRTQANFEADVKRGCR